MSMYNRRRFLTTLGSLGAGLGLSPLVISAEGGIVSTNGSLLQFGGETKQVPDELLRKITIPQVDISGEFERHVIIAQGGDQSILKGKEEWGEYRGYGWQGHPNTLLMPDGKTMFCVWQVYGHSGPGGSLKKSMDGGLTWSDLLDVPSDWYTIGRGSPTIHRLVDREGKARLFVYCRTESPRKMRHSVSEDEGKTWSSLQPIGQEEAWTAPQTIVTVDGGKKHMMWTEKDREGNGRPGVIWQRSSTDGGLTWENHRVVVDFEGARACEPGVIKSPDGQQLLMLIRNQTRDNSLYAVSNDEGESWSAAKRLPWALKGGRHDGIYAPGGRLVVVFRGYDYEAQKSHFYAWVGKYEDIVSGREGQYRIKLFHCYEPDTGYPGIEILPDGTIVATTYLRYKPGQKHSVISTRFHLQELDDRISRAANQIG